MVIFAKTLSFGNDVGFINNDSLSFGNVYCIFWIRCDKLVTNNLLKKKLLLKFIKKLWVPVNLTSKVSDIWGLIPRLRQKSIGVSVRW